MEKTELQNQKENFLSEQIQWLTISAGLNTRGGKSVYHSDINLNKNNFEDKKREFKIHIKNLLTRYGENYINKLTISDDEHIKNIELFIGEAKTGYESILAGRKMRFGIGQKLLNLYLKYLWVLDNKNNFTPPHCPFDSQIAKELKSNYKFTVSDSVKDYEKILEKAEHVSHSKIAEWELKVWNEKNIQINK